MKFEIQSSKFKEKADSWEQERERVQRVNGPKAQWFKGMTFLR